MQLKLKEWYAISKILGNTEGIRDSILDALEQLFDYRIPSDEMFTLELCEVLMQYSATINREIAVYINRRGIVTHVMIGDQTTVSLPQGIPGGMGLSGLRCLHTHPGGTAQLSSVDLSALQMLRLDAMIALALVNGQLQFSWAHLSHTTTQAGENYQVYPPMSVDKVDHKYFMSTIREYQIHYQKIKGYAVVTKKERALLVGVVSTNDGQPDLELTELSLLTETAGLEIVGTVTQKQKDSRGTFYVGFGKAKEISLLAQCLQATVVITDDELSPSQIRRLEELWGLKVIDRTALILDIFAQRARTREGKLQVELAQLKYLLPRLVGHGALLSRQGGGIGTRGPGESKLEMDRRGIRLRISDLEGQLSKVKQQRAVQRKQRQRNALPVVACVGYTNAGKTSLMSNLIKQLGEDHQDHELVGEDKLFATLDPTTRKITLPSGQVVLLSDTVGFVQKLPHHLVNAFRATLEEVLEADLLLHVVDISHPRAEVQTTTVLQVLKDLGAEDKQIITVLNKCDLLSDADEQPIVEVSGPTVLTSVRNNYGMDHLIQQISSFVNKPVVELEVLLPYDAGGLANLLYKNGQVLAQEHTEQGTIYRVRMSREDSCLVENYIIN